MTAWRAATQAAAAANGILALSNTGVAVTAGAATIAMAPLLPLLLPLAAAAVAVTAAFGAFGGSRKEIKPLNETLWGTTDALAAVKRASAELDKLAGGAESRMKAAILIRENEERIAELQGRQLTADQRRAKLAEIQADAQKRIADSAERFAKQSGTGLTQRPGINLGDSANFIQTVNAIQKFEEKAGGLGFEKDMRVMLGLHESALKMAESQSSIARERLRVSEAEQATLQKQIESNRELVKLAEDRLRKQEEQFKSAEQRFGDLDAEKQRELVRIARKAPDQRSLEELRQFAQFGGSRAVGELEGKRMERAASGGFGLFAQEAGIKSDRDQERRLLKQAAEESKGLNEPLENLLTANQRRQEEERGLLNRIIGEVENQREFIAGLSNRIYDLAERNRPL